MAMKVTCFADEISQDLEEQLQVLSEMGLSHLEIRSVWGKNVLELDAEELDRINGMVKERGFGVSSIASPVGKYATCILRMPRRNCVCSCLLEKATGASANY
ncbi:hypothetical protein [Paenibacillus sp. LHD-38]|uniref:hypothetical protein n=1 Tax=Paenibacillus sp. LHD-38 TaxID=3072143 RepID=UPI00280E1D4E|nr:hypothetical protein [Paenibacillus sp. LHD-38]MDQ8735130.1 hypothetical protein [Paenibacillus sp. LHD-38]